MMYTLVDTPAKYVQPFRDYEFYDFLVIFDTKLRTAIMTDYRVGSYPYNACYDDYSQLHTILARYGACFPIGEPLWEQ